MKNKSTVDFIEGSNTSITLTYYVNCGGSGYCEKNKAPMMLEKVNYNSLNSKQKGN